MKIINIILISIVVGLLYSCGQTVKESDTNIKVKNDVDNSLIDTKKSTPQRIESEKKLTKEERKKQIEEEENIDSLSLDFALKDAFKIAKKEFQNDNFIKEYEIQSYDNSFSIYIEIEISDVFKNGSKYFLLRRHVPWATYINIYKIKGEKTEELITREQGEMTYIRDTVFDVNGDKLNDFLVHWYPSSGCCRRNVYNVYLNQPDGKFTSDYRFINPTFSASEKVIRGVGYGHPGEVGLYKYKWNGLEIDTLEFIYPDVSQKGQFIKTIKREYRPTDKQGKVLKEVPKEYLEIESFEWFSEY
ncbi:hypothetical protein [Aureivirga sp. CE67]|uniref:hypothetical protein n=1 Tax=Aureivirga sp. CE67 TaxID=1788983 RepID=UPI0018CAAC08|nr:hypothetical protein [Aureivirga sp. CE67]